MLIGDFGSIEKDIENFNSFIINGICVVDKEVQYKNYKMIGLNSVNTINYDYIIIDTENDLISNEIKISLSICEFLKIKLFYGKI